MKMKKLFSFAVAAAIATSMLPNVFASEITDELDADYNGYVWKAVTDAGEFRNVEDEESGGMFTYEFTDDPEFTSDDNGSVKVTWISTSTKTEGRLLLNVPSVEQKNDMAVKAVSMDVYVPDTLSDGTTANPAIGSEFYCYSGIKTGGYQNGLYNYVAPRKVQAGWNTLVFDTTNADKVYFFIWKNGNLGEVYIDNLRAYYQTPTSVFDSFEDYTVDWEEGAYTLSTNTDKTYIKDGKASLKIENTNNKIGENCVLVSRFLKIGGNDGKNGKQIPLIDGYTAKTFGFWVYSDGATGFFKPLGGNVSQSFTANGWTYLSWTIPASSAWYNWNIDHFNQLVLKFNTSGTIYIDAMSIGYEDNSVTYLDGFESFLWTAGGCYGASGHGLNTDKTYVKDGLASGKFVIPAGKSYDNGEYVYSNNGYGVTIPTAPEGKELKKIGMWIYGTGKAGTSLRPQFHTTGENANNYYRPTIIDLSFEGWKYIEIPLPASTSKLYNFQVKNETDADVSFYIDKITVQYGNTGSSVWTNDLKNGNKKLDLTALNVNDVLNFNVDISKSSDMNYPIAVIIAAYDGDGALLKVNMQKIDASETGEVSKTASVTVESDYEAGVISKVAGFIWNADTQEPLTEAQTVILE